MKIPVERTAIDPHNGWSFHESCYDKKFIAADFPIFIDRKVKFIIDYL